MADASRPRRGPAAFWRDIRLLPNALCVFRTFAIIVAVILFYAGLPYLAVSIGIAGGMTDYADGILARKMGIVSEFGALLDQISDLIFAFLCLVVGYEQGVWPLYILVAWGLRDITTLALRANAAQAGFSIPSSFVGKLASNFLFYAFIIMVFVAAQPFGAAHPVTEIIHIVCLTGIHVGVMLQWTAFVDYIRSYIQQYESTIALPEEA